MPEEKEAPFGMYEKMLKHEEALDSHEERIFALEEADRRHEQRLKVLEDNAIRLENTVMSENRETRTTMKEQTEKLFDVVDRAMSFSSTQETQKHELKMKKWNTVSTILLKAGGGLLALLTSGGGLYLLIEHFVSK